MSRAETVALDTEPAPRAVSNDSVWRALADLSRRRVLDLLRLRPMTTGELSDHFDTTRFAVMKHLGVREDAGLLVVERRGRHRINHLNPVPIQAIYRRWIREILGAILVTGVLGGASAPATIGMARRAELRAGQERRLLESEHCAGPRPHSATTERKENVLSRAIHR